MVKRGVTIGTYDTAAQGWTLTGWSFGPPQFVSNLVDIPGRIDGPLDLTAAVTGGEPRYQARPFTATLERSDGDRLSREAAINTMVNWLDGWRQDIVLPDDAAHYITGRVSVARVYNDPAHASVTVTATCDPWRYSDEETVVNLAATADAQTATLVNSGRRTAVPVLVVTGSGSLNLRFGTASWSLSAGTYQLPDILLTQGSHEIEYSGDGMALTATYREAVL